MSDFEDGEPLDSEEEYDDYASEVESEQEEDLKVVYNELITDKLGTILDFNNGKINEKEYSIYISDINKKLQNLNFEDTTVNRKLIDMEIDLKILLEKYERKINLLKEKQKKDFLTKEEIVSVLSLEYTLESLQSKSEEYVLDTNTLFNRWNLISLKEQEEIINLAAKKGIYFPAKSRLSNEEYQINLEEFFDKFGIFFPGFFDVFEQNEKKEVEGICKKTGIKKPKPGSALYEERLLEFYTKGLQLLPGYIQKMNTTKIGPVFEKIEIKTAIQKVKELQQLKKDLPIRLSEKEQYYQSRALKISILLRNLGKEHLINCIMKTTRFRENISKVVFMNNLTEEEMSLLKKEKEEKEFKPVKKLITPKVEKIPEQITKVDFNLSLKQTEQLLSNEHSNLEIQLKIKRNIEKESFSNIYVINWDPRGVVSDEKVKEWEKFKDETLNSSKNQLIKITLLNEYRLKLLKDYNTNLNAKLADISKKINTTLKNIKDLEQVRVFKVSEEFDKYNSRYIESLKRKYTPPPPPPKTSKKYKVINNLLIGEFVNAYKRKLIINSIKPKEPYRLLDLLELYDLNELNNKIYNYKKVKTIILKLKEYLLNEINKSFNFEIINKKYYLEAIQQISKMLQLNITVTTITNAINQLTSEWNDSFMNEILLDYYGENLFIKLSYTVDPIKFYKNIKEYDALVRQFTPEEEKTYTRAKTIYQGKLYDVFYLDKDWGTHQPLKQYKQELQKNPRTGQFEVVNKTIEKRGKYPFILRQLKTSQEGEMNEIWTEIQPNAITYYNQFGK